MRRRHVLATVAGLLAGCAGSDRSPDSTTRTTTGTATTTVTTSTQAVTPETAPGTTETTAAPETRTRSTPDTTSESTRETTTETQTTDASTENSTTDDPADYSLLPADPDSESPGEVRTALATVSCADLTDSRAVCPGDDAGLAVSRSASVRSLPRTTVEVTIRNDAADAFVWNPYGWELWAYDGTAWRRLAPLAVPVPTDRLAPGEAHTYRVTVDNTRFRGTDSYVTTDAIAVSGLGPGAYALGVEGYFESAPDEEVVVGATFGFAGEGPAVRPTDAVTDLDREGSTLVVRGAVPENPDLAEALAVSLVDADPDATLLPEHVRQVAGLRNTLPYAATGGVDAIRYVTASDAVSTALTYLRAASPDGAETFGFRGLTFEASAAELRE